MRKKIKLRGGSSPARIASNVRTHSVAIAISLVFGLAVSVSQIAHAENQSDVAPPEATTPAPKVELPAPKEMFRITEMGKREATFVYTASNRKGERWRETHHVEAGEDGDVRVAIINRIASIIQRVHTGDVEWTSPRLGHKITLSARPGDDAALKAFLMQEMFGDDEPAHGSETR